MKGKVVVIPAKRWRNKATGETASLYGAVPWVSEVDMGKWEVEVVGWTWELPNGTIGLGRVPAKTKDEAQAVADRLNARRGLGC